MCKVRSLWSRLSLQPATVLEEQLHRHLDDARCRECGDLSKCSVGDAHRGRVPIRVIQDVEEIPAYLESETFPHPELAAESYVEIETSWHDNRISPRVPVGSRCLLLECRLGKP